MTRERACEWLRDQARDGLLAIDDVPIAEDIADLIERMAAELDDWNKASNP